MEEKDPAQLRLRIWARSLTTEQKAEEASPEDRRVRVYRIWCLKSSERTCEEGAPCTGVVGVYKKVLRESVVFLAFWIGMMNEGCFGY